MNQNEILINLVKKKAGNNPIFNRLIDMMNNGDEAGVEMFARNLLKEKGLDLDTEKSKFQKTFKL